MPTRAFERPDRPLIFGHRGASADAPENTLAAFALAVRQGADGVELDVQRCATGEVVVMHDESLARTAGHEGLVTRTSWEVLRTLDAGSHKGAQFAGERIPLLSEVLAEIPVLVNVELKCDTADDGGLTRAAIQVIREARAQDRVLLSSFNPLCLLRARVHGSELARALLFESSAAWPLRNAVTSPLLGLRAMHPDRALATAAKVQRWRARGRAVGVWTVDDPDEAERLRQRGVTAIITNRPGVMRARFGQP